MKKRIIAMVLCIVMCLCICPINASAVSRDTSFEESLAIRLKALGLFQGVSDTDFDLDRAPTRVEALVMLIRVLGQEDEALEKSWSHPFKDVPKWADQYVGYAYENGLTNGVSSTQFGTDNATAATYLTFMLRALGYSDTNSKDFSWKDPFSLATSIGILPSAVNTNNFWRADVVMVSYAALSVKTKGASETLAQKLIAAKTFTKSEYGSYYDTKAFSNRNKTTTLSAEEIYAKCSKAVFNIDTWDIGGFMLGSGSGFFIDSSGIAVTSNRVMSDAHRAVATLANGKEYEITNVIYFNCKYDFAVIKVKGSGFSTMPLGDSSAIKAGDIVYEVGSPLGMENAATGGIVSKPAAKNEDNELSYIQTSVPMSMGNNGCALVNSKGEVVGVDSYFYSKRENVNCVIPINYIVIDAPRKLCNDNSITAAEGPQRVLKETTPFTLPDYAVRNELRMFEVIDALGDYFIHEDEREPNDWPDYQMWIDNNSWIRCEISGNDTDTFRVCCNGTGNILAYCLIDEEIKQYADKIHMSVYSIEGELVCDDVDTYGRMRSLFAWKLNPGVYFIVISLDESLRNQDISIEYTFDYGFYPDGWEDYSIYLD